MQRSYTFSLATFGGVGLFFLLIGWLLAPGEHPTQDITVAHLIGDFLMMGGSCVLVIGLLTGVPNFVGCKLADWGLKIGEKYWHLPVLLITISSLGMVSGLFLVVIGGFRSLIANLGMGVGLLSILLVGVSSFLRGMMVDKPSWWVHHNLKGVETDVPVDIDGPPS